ncbi:MAG: metallophosphoesterase, partial [Chitinophagaceae bacterium]
MLLQYCSDLHLEFPENKRWFNKYSLQPMAPVLVLAGDILPFYELNGYHEFFDQLSTNFEMTYWIPGNHEYYHADITERSGAFSEKIRENVVLLNDQAVVHDDVKLLLSTLWSKTSEARKWKIERSLNDFHEISNGERFFSVGDSNRLHEDSVSFLKGQLDKHDEMKTVVITHHAPTFLNYPPRYKSSELSEAFATELHDFIEGCGSKAWIYGHTHYNT